MIHNCSQAIIILGGSGGQTFQERKEHSVRPLELAYFRPFDMSDFDQFNSLFMHYPDKFMKLVNHQLDYLNKTIYQLFPLPSLYKSM